MALKLSSHRQEHSASQISACTTAGENDFGFVESQVQCCGCHRLAMVIPSDIARKMSHDDAYNLQYVHAVL
jgi:hypothetical protein